MSTIYPRKIILIGFMGAGKSTLAPLLAERLQLPLHEMDAAVCARAGGLSVPQIFESRGESGFRDLESAVAIELGGCTHGVISCGGGVINRPENLAHLRKHRGVVVYLHTSFETVLARLEHQREGRPNLSDLNAARERFTARLPLYRAYADCEVVTDAKEPRVIVDEILGLIGSAFLSSGANGSEQAGTISGHTQLTLIIGDPVAHSLSPRTHNAGYAAAGIDFVMAAAHVTAEGLRDAIAGVRALKIRGLAVTMPHKVTIIPLLDAVDPVAQEIGAVNTVVNDNGRLIGYNTDWRGIIDPLSEVTSLGGKRVTVLGAGGAAQAAVYGCVRAGAQVTVCNRTPERAAPLAHQWGCRITGLDDRDTLAASAVIINTTSVGMKETSCLSPIPTDVLHAGQVIFETIYAPETTSLVAAAVEKGARVIRGMAMFTAQAKAQFELHTGRPYPG